MGGYNTPDTMVEIPGMSVKVGHEIIGHKSGHVMFMCMVV